MSIYRTISLSRQRALTVAECVAFCSPRVPPSYQRSQRGVPTRRWGRSYGSGAVVPPERRNLAMALSRRHRKVGNAVALHLGGEFSPKLRSKGTSVATRGSDSGPQKIRGTTINSPKLDSLGATATVILQQHWRIGGWKKSWGEICSIFDLCLRAQKSLFLRSTFTLPIKRN